MEKENEGGGGRRMKRVGERQRGGGRGESNCKKQPTNGSKPNKKLQATQIKRVKENKLRG